MIPEITITLTEEESRALATMLRAIEPHLNREQWEIAAAIAAKCIAAGQEQTMGMLIEHGAERLAELEERSFAAHPNADAPIRLAFVGRWRWPKFRPAIVDWVRDMAWLR